MKHTFCKQLCLHVLHMTGGTSLLVSSVQLQICFGIPFQRKHDGLPQSGVKAVQAMQLT